LLSNIDEEKQQGLTQKVSALKYASALDMFYKKYDKNCDLKQSSNRDLFASYVGDIVKINEDFCTKDFYLSVSLNGRDFDCGSNFYSQSSVKDSKTNPYNTFLYPKRSGWKAVMDVKNQELIYRPDYYNDAFSFYLGSSELRLAFIVWLLRFERINEKNIVGLIKTLRKVFSNAYCDALYIKSIEFVDTSYIKFEDDECQLSVDDITSIFSVNKTTNPKTTILSNGSFETNPVIESILSTGLIYSETLIKRLAYSLMAKPFVILSGLAGSGKTQLALAFAKCLSENIEEQVCTVSIGADWTNREPLLGYPNALKSGEYVLPESGVLQLLMRANEDPSKPYFLILDEMNLSVVERYFADFLSAMESGEKIKLWDNEEGNVPKEVELPKNVFIIGTINVDETTYMFSPKVLDRANVIEFKIAPDEMEQYLNEKKDIHFENAYSACADMAADFVNKAKSQIQIDNADEKSVLLSFFTELKKVNAEFGYRTVNEISRYLHFAGEDKGMGTDEAIDTAILQKLLPKLHGSRKKLVPVLTSMWQLCLKDGISKEIDVEFIKNDFKYPESAEKIQRMYNAVVDNGFTSFAEA